MSSTVDTEIRQLRIVVGGLAFGVLSFLGVASQVAPIMRGRDQEQVRWMLFVIPAFALGCAIGYLAVRRRLFAEVRARRIEGRRADELMSAMLPAYRRFVVAGGGLIEGPGFFSVITYLMTGDTVALAAVGLAIGLLIAHLPSAEALRRIVDAESLA